MRTHSDVLCKRLDELAAAVAAGPAAIAREFTMRIPANPDRDADIVLSDAAKRISELESKLSDLVAYCKDGYGDHEADEIINAEKLLEQPR